MLVIKSIFGILINKTKLTYNIAVNKNVLEKAYIIFGKIIFRIVTGFLYTKKIII